MLTSWYETNFTPEIRRYDGHTVFLAGPIQGAPDWQKTASGILVKALEDVEGIVANPRREYLDKEFDYDAQTDWEEFYLNEAWMRNGIILFWLAKEVEHDPKRAYAQTTRFELAKYNERSANMVVGIEKGFYGERYIRKYVGKGSGDVPFFDTLKETVDYAVKYIKEKKV